MSFALLSTAQVAVLASLTAAAVAVIFFLKMRHPRVEVPSLVLWRKVLDEQRRDSLLERLRRIISLLLALAIALLIAFAVGEPQRAGSAEGRIALVVDNSSTMSARADDGGTRFERALLEAQAIVRGAPGARFQIADTAGTVLSAPDLDRAAAGTALARITPQFTDARLPALAEGYAPTVITDGLGLELPADQPRIIIPGPSGNVGITAFEIRQVPARPEQHEAYLSIVNFDASPREVVITIGGPGREGARRSVTLAPGGRLTDILPMTGLDPGIVEVRLVGTGDGLDVDDVAYGWLPDPRPVVVTLVSNGNPALESVLAADPGLTLRRLTPDEYDGDAGGDVVVFDGATPEAPPRRPALILGAETRPWLETAAVPADPGAALVADPHPVMRAVSLSEVRVETPRTFTTPELTVLARRGSAPVIVAGRGDRPWIAVGFDIGASNFSSQPAFPIFIRNAVSWLGEPPPPVAARLGLVQVPAEGARIVDANGSVVPSIDAPGETLFMADRPGVYFAEHDGGRQAIGVNLLDRETSALGAGRAAVEADVNARAPGAAGSVPLWVWLATAAFALLVLEWWTWQRRITV